MNGQDAFSLVLEKLEERNEQLGQMDQRLTTMREENLKLERQVQSLERTNAALNRDPGQEQALRYPQPTLRPASDEHPF